MTLTSKDSLLGPEHYDLIVQARDALARLLPEIDRAEQCGVDCGDIKAGRQYLADRAEKFLNAYFPNAGIPGQRNPVPREPTPEGT
jgi:hypothetical protein